jgi:hypothetical protein
MIIFRGGSAAIMIIWLTLIQERFFVLTSPNRSFPITFEFWLQLGSNFAVEEKGLPAVFAG